MTFANQLPTCRLGVTRFFLGIVSLVVICSSGQPAYADRENVLANNSAGEQETTATPDISALMKSYMELYREHRALVAKLGPNHPEVSEQQQRIQLLQRQIKDAAKQHRDARRAGRISSAGKTNDNSDFPATHRQVEIIKVLDQKDKTGRKLTSFCLNADGNLLAAVTGPRGEVHVLDGDGELQDTWNLPVQPEAINMTAEGIVMIAGEGQLVALDARGSVIRQSDAPHIGKGVDREEVRRNYLEQRRRSAAVFQKQLTRIGQQIEQIELGQLTDAERGELSALEAQIDRGEEKPFKERSGTERKLLKTRKKLALLLRKEAETRLDNSPEAETQRRNLARQKQMMAPYRQQMDRAIEPLSDEQLDSVIESTARRKVAVASISVADDAVFIATNSSSGFGYDVWRMDLELADAEKIVTGLRGCCGQMDVQASSTGVYVAENGRHRVARFDRDGEAIGSWGKRARSGVAGFGGCCNPMNVTFGPDGSVYTAESSTGRIKKFDADGNLQALIGAVELVPGCKKVSIAVGEDGDRIFMLDITRNHIVVMQRKERPSETDVEDNNDKAVDTPNETVQATTTK